jgi:hypothetical protein
MPISIGRPNGGGCERKVAGALGNVSERFSVEFQRFIAFIANVGDSAVGGWGGIRTHDTVSRIHTFQACAFDRSATHPSCRARCAAAETKSELRAAKPLP